MKTIIKRREPYTFIKWKADHPTLLYNDLHGSPSVKGRLKFRLISEQKQLCCYCEKRIGIQTCHIEHFKPKATGKFPHFQLDYTNLHASCGLKPSRGTDSQCGHKKADVFSHDLLSPLDSDCERHFSFNPDGHILPNTAQGKTTIDVLNLNSASLVQSRMDLIDYFLNEFDAADRSAEIAAHLSESEKEYGEFFTTIKYLSENNYL